MQKENPEQKFYFLPRGKMNKSISGQDTESTRWSRANLMVRFRSVAFSRFLHNWNEMICICAVCHNIIHGSDMAEWDEALPKLGVLKFSRISPSSIFPKPSKVIYLHFLSIVSVRTSNKNPGSSFT